MSGLTSLGYQVVWNRLLGAGTGSSTYVFTIILALFLVGIAIGAVLLGVPAAARPPDDAADRRPRRSLTAVFVIVGAAVLASPPTPLNGASPDVHRRAARLRVVGARSSSCRRRS